MIPPWPQVCANALSAHTRSGTLIRTLCRRLGSPVRNGGCFSLYPLLSLFLGLAKVGEDADVLGGWSAGLFIAVLSAMLYNHYRRGRKAPRDATALVPLTRF